MNKANPQSNNVISSLNCRRASVIKWAGTELNSKNVSNNERASKSPSSLAKNKVVGQKSNKAEKYPCSFCGKSFKWRSHWESHERIHTGLRPFICEICGKTFTRSDGLQCHKVLHITRDGSLFPSYKEREYVKRTEKLPKTTHSETTCLATEYDEETVSRQRVLNCCHICNRVFVSSVRLMKHIHAHEGRLLDFKCEVCNKTFVKKSALEIHSRVHTGVKPYECNICTKSFSIHGNLKRHLLTHTVLPYKCLKCSNGFGSQSHLSKHLKTKHRIYY